MGEVWKAKDNAFTKTEFFKAVKFLSQDLSRSPEIFRRFEQEADVLARLNKGDHHIVKIITKGVSRGVPYLLMDYVCGPNGESLDLGQLIRQEERLDLPTTRRLFLQILDALGFAHSLDIVHRDVKPGNILIDEEKNGRLADFGIAAFDALRSPADDSAPSSGASGTRVYMAPEQEKGEVNLRCDIYSCGIILYEMIVGHPPSDAKLDQLRNNKANVRVVEDWVKIIRRCTRLDPAKRYETTNELRADVKEASTKDGVFKSIRNFIAKVDPEFDPGEDQKPDPTATTCAGCGRKVRAEDATCPHCGADITNLADIRDNLDAASQSLDAAKRRLKSALAGNVADRYYGFRQAAEHAEDVIRRLADDQVSKSFPSETEELLGKARDIFLKAEREAANSALLDNNFSVAKQHYLRLVGVAPNHNEACEWLRIIDEARQRYFKEATEHFNAGRIKFAIVALQNAQRKFPDDGKIQAKLRKYEEEQERREIENRRLRELMKQGRLAEASESIDEIRASRGDLIHPITENYGIQCQHALGEVQAPLNAAATDLRQARYQDCLDDSKQALSIIADHPDALRLKRIAETCRQNLGACGEKLDHLAKHHRWGEASDLLGRVQSDIGQRLASVEELSRLAEGVAEGVARANNHRRRVLMVLTGAVLWRLTWMLGLAVSAWLPSVIGDWADGLLHVWLVFSVPLIATGAVLPILMAVFGFPRQALQSIPFLIIASAAGALAMAVSNIPVAHWLLQVPLDRVPPWLEGVINHVTGVSPWLVFGAVAGLIVGVAASPSLETERPGVCWRTTVAGALGGLIAYASLVLPGPLAQGLLWGLVIHQVAAFVDCCRGGVRILFVPLCAGVAIIYAMSASLSLWDGVDSPDADALSTAALAAIWFLVAAVVVRASRRLVRKRIDLVVRPVMR